MKKLIYQYLRQSLFAIAGLCAIGAFGVRAAPNDALFSAGGQVVTGKVYLDSAPGLLLGTFTDDVNMVTTDNKTVTGYDHGTLTLINPIPSLPGVLGTVTLEIQFTCMKVINNMSIQRWRIIDSNFPALKNMSAMSVGTDNTPFNIPDTDHAVMPALPAVPGVIPCSPLDKYLTIDINPAAMTIIVDSGNNGWSVNDGLPN